MMHVQSKEESSENKKRLDIEMSDWWYQLTHREKYRIYDHNKQVIDQVRCTHEFDNRTFYDKSIKVCRKCDYTIEIEPKPSCPCDGNCQCNKTLE